MEFTQELIQRAEKGDQEAITVLYQSTYSTVYKTVHAMVRDEDTVLDIVQDSYLKAFRSFSQLDAPEHFGAWMKRIAANKAKDFLKKKKPVFFSEMAGEGEEEDVPDFLDEYPDHSPEAVMDQNETTRLINEILDTLSEEQRLVIGMFYYEEMTVREIAELLECSENTVKSRLNYGRKKIEAKVRELEKKGTKLYSLAPIPFMLWLFRQDAQAAELPSQAVLSVLQSTCAQTAASASAAGTSVAETAASASAGGKAAGVESGTAHAMGAAGKSAAHTAARGLGTKIAAGVLAAAVVGGGAAAVYRQQSSRQNTAVEVQEATNDESAPNENAMAAQSAVNEQEAASDAAASNGNAAESGNSGADSVAAAANQNDHRVYDNIIEEFTAAYASSGYVEGFGNAYAFYDLNADGVDELVISDVYTDESGQVSANTICQLYTVINGAPQQVVNIVFENDPDESLEASPENIYELAENGYIHNYTVMTDMGEPVGRIAPLRLTEDGNLKHEMPSEGMAARAHLTYTVLGEGEKYPSQSEIMDAMWDRINAEFEAAEMAG